MPKTPAGTLKVCPNCGGRRMSNALLTVNPLTVATNSFVHCDTCGYEGLPLEATPAALKRIRFRKR
ncbi:MAG: hypothetical protein V1787_01245 [Candidatus Micrarchaeota archaeon]